MWLRRARTTSEVPDCVDPVVAWRFWYALEGDGPTLSSVNFEVPWPTGRPLEASCMMEEPRSPRWASLSSVHPAPASDCGCGIYAVPFDHLRRCLPRKPERDPNRVVVGQVALWGLVHEHQRGWRASFAYPQRLFVASFAEDGAPERIAARLLDYEVPVQLLDAPTMVAGLSEVSPHPL